MYRTANIGPASTRGDALSRRPFPTRFDATTLSPLERSRAPTRRDAPFSLVVDLGVGIGSRDWLRGAATCGLLCYAAWSFMPAMGSTPGLSPAPLSAAESDEVQALAIRPLAAGATSGRRMIATDAVQPLANAPERAIVDIRATVSAPGAIAAALTRAGVASVEADAIAAMIGGVTPLGDIAAGTPLDLRLGRRARPIDPRPVERLALRASFALAVTIARDGGRLTLNPTRIAVDTTPLRIQGAVGPSLYRSARAAGVPARIVEAYIRVLSGQEGVLAGLGESDRFDLIVDHRRAATGETEAGALLYAGLARADGRTIRLMPWTIGGTAQWFEASGVGRETSTGFRMPVHGRMTSPFGRRVHPILRYVRMHQGIDFGAPYGAPIVAAASGQVVLAGWDGGYGRAVKVSHGGGLLTRYGHMSRIAVTPGQQVAAGQVIGYVGSTGMSTGPHLHYELHRNGVQIDPASFRFTSRSALGGGDLAAFRERMRWLLTTPVGAPPSATPGFASVATNAPMVRPPVSRPVTAPLPGVGSIMRTEAADDVR